MEGEKIRRPKARSVRVLASSETRRGREGVLSEAWSRSVLRFGVAMMLSMIAMHRSARLNLCPDNTDRASGGERATLT